MSAPHSLIAFFQSEAIETLDHLDRLLSDAEAGAIDAAAFLSGAQALRGSAALTRLEGLTELAATMERLAVGIRDQAVRWDLRLLHAVRGAIVDLRTLIHRADAWGEAEQRLSRSAAVALATTASAHLAAAPLPEVSTGAIVPVARLAPDDGRPGILERNPTPPITLAQRFRVDLADAAAAVDREMASLEEIGRAASSLVVTDALRRALMALADLADSYAATSVASLATKMARAPLSSPDERAAIHAFARLLLDRDRTDAELAVEVRQASLAWSGHGSAPVIVSIDTLLYRGQAALQRARDVRTALREYWQRGTLGVPEAHALFDELSDLLDLAVST